MNERLDLFSFALEHGASYADVEMENDEAFLDKIKDLTLKYNHDLIISYHNYENTPSAGELESILESCYRKGATVAKIATMVSEDKDIANLLGLYRKKGRKVILGMGDKGLITRVASVPLGAEFTFASSSAGEATAPGQLTVKELTEIYNILKIN